MHFKVGTVSKGKSQIDIRINGGSGSRDTYGMKDIIFLTITKKASCQWQTGH